MRKNITIRILITVFSMWTLASCFEEQDVSGVIGPENNAVITMTRVDANSGNSTIAEGDTIVFQITSSKMLETAVDFTTTLLSEAEVDDHDFEVIGGVLAPYSTSTTLSIVILEDNFPEVSESINVEIDAYDMVQRYHLNPQSDVGNVSLGVSNKNMEGVITIALSWPDEHDDLDMYIFSVNEDDDWGGNGAATGSNPEISTALWPADPDGTYYVGIDPYHLETGATDYKFSIGYEDGTVEFFEGHFDIDDADSYEVDNGAYRLLQVVLSGGTATITHVNQ